MVKYYDGQQILNTLDLQKKKPEIFMVVSNRTDGKTTYFGKKLIEEFVRTGKQFGLLYRFNLELSEIEKNFYGDIGTLFFPGAEFTSKMKAKGTYSELTFEGRVCGFGIALNQADRIKKMSHLFHNIDHYLFDEFQSETNHYCSDEVKKFISIHTSISRGHGKQTRYVPVYMLSNPVTLLNPYYTEFGVSNRLRKDTKILRGEGWVLQHHYNEHAAKAMRESGFNRAFSSNTYAGYQSEGVYLNDSYSFIEKPTGKSSYLCSIKYKGKLFGVREYAELGFMYVTNKADASFPIRITTTTEDHAINYVMLRKNDFLLNNLRFLFEQGCFRFQDMATKEALLSTLSY